VKANEEQSQHHDNELQSQRHAEEQLHLLRMKSQLSDIIAQLEAAIEIHGPDHPLVAKLKVASAAIKARIVLFRPMFPNTENDQSVQFDELESLLDKGIKSMNEDELKEVVKALVRSLVDVNHRVHELEQSSNLRIMPL
jgi:hypothetical protein